MPLLQTTVLADRETAPVNHTFVPRDVKDGRGVVVNSTGVPIGDERLTVSMKEATSRYNGEVKLVLPVVQNETINGVVRPTVVRTAYVTMNFSFDKSSTLQERKNAVGLAAAALATNKPLINDALINLESVWG
ncbi:coat protein [ssRNA phage SRR5467091_5]|uniref:Coat protein n=1 Tax=ssRNA phage SRR5467091_5 TaxID=2786470 RepID=A0A8S5L507_9VIRU|nr:coat protein [ssRNA phage SRR5467091_5]DAD52508.1 TPA_asm: coat protein [ssRNA phage SRR5467091_5]